MLCEHSVHDLFFRNSKALNSLKDFRNVDLLIGCRTLDYIFTFQGTFGACGLQLLNGVQSSARYHFGLLLVSFMCLNPKDEEKSGKEWKTKPQWGKNMPWTPSTIKHDHSMLSRHLSKPYSRLANRVVTQRVYSFFHLFRKNEDSVQ